MEKGIGADIMPAYYGAFRSGELFGFEEECFLEKSRGGVWDRVRTLDEAVGDPSTDLRRLRDRLLALKEEIIAKNILITDAHGANMLIAEKDGIERLVVIDGYGTPELVPLPKWFRPLGRRKILRKWRDLEERLPFLI